MKKEYITPEVEMTKFVEAEEIMTGPTESWLGVGDIPDGVLWQ